MIDHYMEVSFRIILRIMEISESVIRSSSISTILQMILNLIQ